MNHIETLIQKHCPNGVEFRALQEICNLRAGDRIIKSMMNVKEKYPVMGGGVVPTGYYKGYNFSKGVTIARAGSAGFVSWQENPFWATDVCFVATLPQYCHTERSEVSKNKSADLQNHLDSSVASLPQNDNIINLKFLYYFLKTSQSDLQKHLYGASMPKLDKQYLWNFQIPIPPLEIQYEIVKILDTFTELEKELEKELEARRKQYEYYREKLLSFESLVHRAGGGQFVKMMRLGKICKCFAGGTPKTNISAYWDNGTISWMSSGEVNKGTIYETDKKITQLGYDKSSTKMIPPNSVVLALAGQGKTRGSVARIKISLCTNQSLCAIVPNEDLNYNFLYFYLKNQYKQLRQVSSGDGTRGGLNLKMVQDFQIPIPPLKVQNEVVDILDRFDKLTNDISEGIPAEINARKKQYEYYREQLLTFKEAK